VCICSTKIEHLFVTFPSHVRTHFPNHVAAASLLVDSQIFSHPWPPLSIVKKQNSIDNIFSKIKKEYKIVDHTPPLSKLIKKRQFFITIHHLLLLTHFSKLTQFSSIFVS